MNYKYAKIISENEVQYAPRVIKINNKTYINPKEKIYNQAGYYKLYPTNYPEDGNEYIPSYSITDGVILQGWIKM